ncbi:peroxidase family protein [Mesorhizobium sp. M0217]|uniref:peroxidase family protein n=1 Tax=unclassified Mesorhizobium TaxID=325217 RepID=UPI003339C7B4
MLRPISRPAVPGDRLALRVRGHARPTCLAGRGTDLGLPTQSVPPAARRRLARLKMWPGRHRRSGTDGIVFEQGVAMRHGEYAAYEALVNYRRIFDSTRANGGPAVESLTVESATEDPGEALRRLLLFPDLAEKPMSLMPAGEGSSMAERTRAALSDISNCMLGPADPVDPPDMSDNPAAYTYFGQFVFHDIVFSRIFGIPSDPAGRSLRNAVSGSLDLSGLYGRGLAVDAHLYDAASESDTTLCRFPIGLPGVSDKQVKLPVNGAIERARDVPRIDGASGFLNVCGRKRPYHPLIGDPRNDDNLILSQLQCALMQVHNRLVDLQMARHAVSPRNAFEQARLYLTSVYRRVIVDDYLRRILDPKVWAHFFDGEEFRGLGVASLKPLADLPMEFTFGASRFAHSMIRDRYAVNQAFDDQAGTLLEILAFSSQRPNGDVPVRVNWAVDWSRFAESSGAAKLVKARRISPFLTYEMAVVQHTADFDGEPRSIAFMDCWRCYELGIASGQAIAGAVAAALSVDVPVLSGARMLPTDLCRKRYGFQAGELEKALQAHPQFLTETPLSYYVMQEAAELGDDGNRLGPTGSYIVAATVAAALFNAEDSEIQTSLSLSSAEPDSVAGLLRLADDRLVSDDQLYDYFQGPVHLDIAGRAYRRTGNIAT